jgi:ribosome-associated translation inhibitor RaiA
MFLEKKEDDEMNFLRLNCLGFSCTDEILANVEQHAWKLQHFYDRIAHCEVTIERGNGHGRNGRIFHVQIHLSIPGRDIYVNREAEKNHAHEDIHLSIRDTFKAARRKLEDEVRIRRGFVKLKHQPGPISESGPTIL